jgi:hypothetical protein
MTGKQSHLRGLEPHFWGLEPSLQEKRGMPRANSSGRWMILLMPSEAGLESVFRRGPRYDLAAGQGVSRLVTSWLSNRQTSGWGFEPGGGILWKSCLPGSRRQPGRGDLYPAAITISWHPFLSLPIGRCYPGDRHPRGHPHLCVHPRSDVGHERSASRGSGHRRNLRVQGLLMTARPIRRQGAVIPAAVRIKARSAWKA